MSRTTLPPDTRSDEAKAQDGVPKNQRYLGGVGKPLLPLVIDPGANDTAASIEYLRARKKARKR